MQCPTCGAGLGPGFATLKMASCPDCGTASFLEDGAFRAAGSSGVMHAGPALIARGTKIATAGETFTVTESETAECLALRGLFPEVLRLGERYRFVDCADATGRLLSGERGPDGWLWFLGSWFDPFEIIPA